MKRTLSAFLAVLMIGALLAGCTPKEPQTGQQGGTLIVSHGDDPISFNPNWKTDDYLAAIASNIYNKLVTLDGAYNVLPDLAQEWKVSDDGLEYTFTIPEGVKWHDGEPCTSKDIKWTFDQIIAEKGNAYTSLEAIDHITTPDDVTAVFHLKQRDASFLGFLAWYGTHVMPAHIYEGTDWTTNPANQDPIGTGPFKFVEWKKGEHVTLEAFDDYFEGRPNLDKLIFRIIPDPNTALQAFLNGEVDVEGVRPPLSEIAGLQAKDGVTVSMRATPSRYYLAFNLRIEPWNDFEVRKAVAYAIDRDEVVEKALKGLGDRADGFYTPAIEWAYNDVDVLPARNVALANDILDKAGYPKDDKGIRFQATLPYFQGSDWDDMATVVRANLKEVGIDVKLEVLEIAAWIQKVVEDNIFDITLVNGFQGPDPAALKLRVTTEGSLQMMGYSNADVDRLIDEAGQLTDTTERAKKYKEVQKIVSEELPMIPLAEVTGLTIIHDYVKGHPMIDGIWKVGLSDYQQVWLDK